MVTIIGTVAFDSVKTPRGSFDRILGGSATYASVAASLFNPVEIVSIVGRDFPEQHLQFFKSRHIGTQGVVISGGQTFHWKGYYEGDMNQAFTQQTDLNVLLEFDPVIPAQAKNSRIVFLANLDPELQLKALHQFRQPEVVILDSMNFWIDQKREALLAVLKEVDVLVLNDQEIRQLTQKSNLIQAMHDVVDLGPKRVIVKKGEHGSMMYDGSVFSICPALPLVEVVDPTGAGDSFAGAIAGYLAQAETISDDTFRKAMLAGTLMSSFTVQGFSLDRLKTVDRSLLNETYQMLRNNVFFPDMI
ncbi:MAG: PfkB family carbohydrate kinase [Candidatus Margulisiibacteriota bacterium]